MAERKWFKGKAAQALDEWYSSGNVRDNLEYARGLLKSKRSLKAIITQLDSDGRKDDEFIYPRGDGALQGSEFERVVRRGYLEAIDLALRHKPPVAIKTFWMTGAGNAAFEMHITDDTDHVSATLLVPKVEGGATEQDSPESRVVRVEGGKAKTKRTSPTRKGG
jgi:hypothetical protein